MTEMRVKRLEGKLGGKPLDGAGELLGAYTDARDNLLRALREFAHKEF
jgi:hypothetical protein